jgi:hypothetical protein
MIALLGMSIFSLFKRERYQDEGVRADRRLDWVKRRAYEEKERQEAYIERLRVAARIHQLDEDYDDS